MTDDARRARKRAKHAVQRALKVGALTHPTACQRCGRPSDGQRFDALHLNGFEPPHELDVVFWCRACAVTVRSARVGALGCDAGSALTDADRRRYVERLEEESAELRFRLRAAGLRPTDRDWAADRYFPQRGLVNLLWFLLDGGETSRSDLDVLFQAIELAEKHAPAAPLDRPSAVRDVSAPGGGGT